MDRIRQRMAIGVFATPNDLEAMIRRLKTLGAYRFDCLSSPTDQTRSELALSSPVLHADEFVTPQWPASGSIMLRICLETVADEQVVARALLESAAKSVQLHDVYPPEATSR